MSFAAEPYATFVDDLLADLTGGVSRVRFRFVDDELPFQLGAHERVRPESLRVVGIAQGAFAGFAVGRDLDFVAEDGTLAWRESEPGVPAAGATWPDPGTDVWVGFDRLPGGPAPLLTDRNPGSVVRTLAESFALELAVLSHQLELVYQGAFVDSAGGRDLEQIAALVGVERRGVTSAFGELVFRRSSPASADITIVAGTLVSTAQVPLVAVETTDTATLRRGTLSVTVPVRALQTGPAGVAPALSLTVLHRPIFGIEDVLNPEPLSFSGGTEPDEELRSRIKRALDTAGRSTVGAIKGALASFEQIREQDVLVEEDHLASPGLVRVTVAAELDPATAVAASQLLEEYRPAGVRILHNLPAPSAPAPSVPEDTGGGGDGPAPEAPITGVWEPLVADVTVIPADSQLTAEQRDRLALDVAAAVQAEVDAIGVGEPLIYNRVVAGIMAVEGVLDTVLEIGRKGTTPLTRFNLRPSAGTRPRLDPADLTVRLRGDRVVVDLFAVVERLSISASEPTESALDAIRLDIEQRLVAALLVTPPELSPLTLLGMLTATDRYRVEAVSYRVELLDQGLRVARLDVVVPLDPDQQIWVRSVTVTERSSG
jgi:uncharacterized phage protein gp47/JayE